MLGERLPPKTAVTEGGGHSQGHSITAGRSNREKDPSFSSYLPISFQCLPLTKPRLQPEAPSSPLKVPHHHHPGLREGQREFCWLSSG